MQIPSDSTVIVSPFHLGGVRGGNPSRTPNPDPSQLIAHNAEIARLKARDAQVRAHEQAHVAAAGGLATGGPKFSFQRGPDGKLYAVGAVPASATQMEAEARRELQQVQTERLQGVPATSTLFPPQFIDLRV
ncbi:MAG: putative metalloprotease CJM1_0395 family protein [Dehalococcoidia bacterium]